ncbi:hypothetical protein WP50_22215 [Lactiplantibacillus plantarum]|nr:hypothetical protein WP50_22215 [Lactiplantibacillus plantarum]
MTQSKIRPWIINALVAAMYVVLCLGPAAFSLASGAIQFRVSEGLNHLAVFNRKYIWGIVAGVYSYQHFQLASLRELLERATIIFALFQSIRGS